MSECLNVHEVICLPQGKTPGRGSPWYRQGSVLKAPNLIALLVVVECHRSATLFQIAFISNCLHFNIAFNPNRYRNSNCFHFNIAFNPNRYRNSIQIDIAIQSKLPSFQIAFISNCGNVRMSECLNVHEVICLPQGKTPGRGSPWYRQGSVLKAPNLIALLVVVECHRSATLFQIAFISNCLHFNIAFNPNRYRNSNCFHFNIAFNPNRYRNSIQIDIAIQSKLPSFQIAFISNCFHFNIAFNPNRYRIHFKSISHSFQIDIAIQSKLPILLFNHWIKSKKGKNNKNKLGVFFIRIFTLQTPSSDGHVLAINRNKRNDNVHFWHGDEFDNRSIWIW